MCAWRENKHIDFNFCDCQLAQELRSNDESYIKRKCRDRIDLAGTYIMLIGDDTRSKHTYVRWEAEIAIEKGCRIIGVNLNGVRSMQADRTPPIIRDIGAVFVAFSPHIVAHALAHYRMGEKGKNYFYSDDVYGRRAA
jgi:hypothetical protein